MIRLLVDTGIRRGEAVGLKWSNIDFDNNRITIDGSLDYTQGYGVYRAETKSGKTRCAFFSAESGALLKMLLQKQNSSGIISQFVFCQPGSVNPIHPQTANNHLSRFEKRNNLPHLHPHKMRHTFGSIAATNGMDLVSIKEVMGHSDIKTTQKYCHGNDESRRKVAETVFSALEEAK